MHRLYLIVVIQDLSNYLLHQNGDWLHFLTIFNFLGYNVCCNSLIISQIYPKTVVKLIIMCYNKHYDVITYFSVAKYTLVTGKQLCRNNRSFAFFEAQLRLCTFCFIGGYINDSV